MTNVTPNTISDRAFDAISALAKNEAGLVLPKSKLTMVQSRLRTRLAATGIPDYETYAEFVGGSDGLSERRLMISALTTNVSHFFRENHHFDIMRRDALPQLVQKAKSGKPVRIWSAGCSSGQEPYSIAMLILDAAPELASLDTLILGTDIDTRILEKAEAGIYSTQQIQGVPEAYRGKFLNKTADSDQMQVAANVKRLVRFRELNLLHDWPMKSRFDIIFCRNVVIYFDGPTQDSLWPRFDAALHPDGWFFLGHSERVSEASMSRFTSVGMTAYKPITGSPPHSQKMHA